MERKYQMKKRELAARWVATNQAMLACPICGSSLTLVEQSGVRCENGHAWDFNRAGSLHFLQTTSAANGYDQEMLEARRRVLQAGFFQPMVAAVNAALPQHPVRLIDVGTGEGTPLAQLQALRGEGDVLAGFDISKAGVQLATQLNPASLFFCVADLRHLPFATNSLDAVIEFFSPADYDEFDRVLKPGGQVLKIVPTGHYLQELRQLLYPADSAHRHYDNQLVKDRFKERYPQASVQTIQYQFDLAPELRADLVAMSPLHWGQGAKEVTAADLERLAQVTVEVELLSGIKPVAKTSPKN